MQYNKIFDGHQWMFTFQNGYGLSVVCHERSYGGKQGLFEVGLVHEGVLCYTHPEWPDAVRGWLTFQDVAHLATHVEMYPVSRSYCADTKHGRDTV